MNLYRAAAVVTLFSAAEHCLGFLYRIILSRTVGPEGLGVYQAAYTVFAVFLTLSASGLPVTLSRIIARHRARGDRRRERSAVTAGVLLSLAVSLPLTLLLFALRAPFSRVFADPRCADLFYILLTGLSCTSVYAVLRGSFWGNKRFFAYSFVELVEEMIRIGVGVCLLLTVGGAIWGATLAAVAVLVSYLASFAIALIYFFVCGGAFRAPGRELRPLLLASLPVTAMRTSSSLLSSLISVLFPLRLRAAGHTSAAAMRQYGVVYGMVMPVMAIPCAFVSSIALVLVPELAEHHAKGDREQVRLLARRALRAALLLAAALLPLYAVCGADVCIMLYSNAESGVLLSRSALLLFPMSVTMIASSMLNSLGCERQTLLIFLAGSAGMLLCTLLLPRLLGGGALLVGMGCESTVTALLSLLLLRRKTGAFDLAPTLCKLLVLLPVTAAGYGLHRLFTSLFSFLPALFLTMFCLLALELAALSLVGLVRVKGLLRPFFGKKGKKIAVQS